MGMLTLLPFERLDMQPQEVSEGELFHINEVEVVTKRVNLSQRK